MDHIGKISSFGGEKLTEDYWQYYSVTNVQKVEVLDVKRSVSF
jgi:hypothetical protein